MDEYEATVQEIRGILNELATAAQGVKIESTRQLLLSKTEEARVLVNRLEAELDNAVVEGIEEAKGQS
jgi:hypothetical protein